MYHSILIVEIVVFIYYDPGRKTGKCLSFVPVSRKRWMNVGFSFFYFFHLRLSGVRHVNFWRPVLLRATSPHNHTTRLNNFLVVKINTLLYNMVFSWSLLCIRVRVHFTPLLLLPHFINCPFLSGSVGQHKRFWSRDHQTRFTHRLCAIKSCSTSVNIRSLH